MSTKTTNVYIETQSSLFYLLPQTMSHLTHLATLLALYCSIRYAVIGKAEVIDEKD